MIAIGRSHRLVWAVLAMGLRLGLQDGSGLTSGNVSWSGGAGELNPYWNVDANWQGGEAPTNPSSATVTFTTNNQPLASILDTDRTVGSLVSGTVGVTAAGDSRTTQIDLDGHILAIETTFGSIAGNQSARNTFIVNNGTVQLGSDAKAANLTIGASATLILAPGTMLNATNLGTLTIGISGYIPSYLDLRGATIAGGTLAMNTLTMQVGSWRGTQLRLNAGTQIDRLWVRGACTIGSGGPGHPGYPMYIGDPDNPFSFEGVTYGMFPAGIDLVLGVSPASRGSLLLTRSTHTQGFCAIRVAPGGGGHFTAYLSSLTIATASANNRKPRGLLDLSAMDGCLFDVQTLAIAPGLGDLTLDTDDDRGDLRLPRGTGTVVNAVIGAPLGLGYGKLSLSNTCLTVTGSLTLNATASIDVAIDAACNGIDVTGSFADGGGAITARFIEAPDPGALIPALRVAGDVRGTLQTMVTQGRLSADSAPPDGFWIGVLYDEADDVTLFALADDLFYDSALVMQARPAITVERAPGRDVVIGVADIDLGSYDPDGEPMSLGLATSGGIPTPSLNLDADGDYAVVLSAETAGKHAAVTCTVHVVALAAPVDDDVTWLGSAATALMARREWLWSGNWLDGAAPANPTPATIRYLSQGMGVTGQLETDRTVGGLQAGVAGVTVNHTLDLAGYALTVSNQVSLTGATTLSLTNGTLRMGIPGCASAGITVGSGGRLRFLPGTRLAGDNLGIVSIASAGVLDLRGSVCIDGLLPVRQLFMVGDQQNSALLYLDATTALDTLRITESLNIISSANSGMIYIGNPNDDGRLPPGMSLRVGTSTTARAEMIVCRSTSSHASNAKIVATGGGTFTGWISTLDIGTRSGTGIRNPRGTVDLAAMDACDLDILTLNIAPGAAEPGAADDERGTLRLPPGNATIGTAIIGATDGIGYGRLEMSNTVVTVTNTLAIRATGAVNTRVGTGSSGLDIVNPDPDAFTIATGASLTLQFVDLPESRPHYGLRWQGEHVATFVAMLNDGRIVVDTPAFGRTVHPFRLHGATCIGLQDRGTVIVCR